MAIIRVTDESFENDVLKSNRPVVVDFWAQWCGPCKQLAPMLEEISEEMADDIVIAKLDCDANPNSPSAYGVRGLPTLIMFSDGEVKAQKVGVANKQSLVEWIKEGL